MLGLGIVGMALAPLSANAAVFKPTRHDDPPPGKCKPSDCSLREAVLAADVDQNRDRIVLGRGTYRLQIPYDPPPYFGFSGELDIYNPVTIVGKGPGDTKINGEGLDRVIGIDEGIEAGTGAIVLQKLTVTGGDATTNDHGNTEGGGIAAFGEKLILSHVSVRGNKAGFGGGIEAYNQVVDIDHSTIAGNAAIEGGGIRAIASPAPGTIVNVTASTISGNGAGKGGGVLADGSVSLGSHPPTVVFLNSTVAGNHTTAEAGGIMADNGATVGLYNSTVAYNKADSDNSGGGDGGGIHQHSGATFLVYDSVLDGNTVGSSGTGSQCDGTFSGVGNVYTAAGGCGSLAPGPNLSVGGGAELFTLGDYGGPTQTIELRPTSQAIGFATKCPKYDQRGELRPATGCDSGSYERNPLP